ncbi:MAG: NADH-quinone oxidoreductase subunit K [Gammaproteobacteria bacterium]
MSPTIALYLSLSALLFALGLHAALVRASTIDRLLGINVMGAGVFLMFITAAYRGPGVAADPLPHALVLTGIVVAVSATAMGLALSRALAKAKAREAEADVSAAREKGHGR